MKVIAFNGSPRKKWNTATLLNKALEGAAIQGAETELYHLYDLSFKGCMSCFACKTREGESYGRCAIKDDLFPIFRMVEGADALILGSPVYFVDVSGEMRSFRLENHMPQAQEESKLSTLWAALNIPPGSAPPHKYCIPMEKCHG